MEQLRKPFQGVGNIIRFNWHFYLLSFAALLLIILLSQYLPDSFKFYLQLLCFCIINVTLISLLVSYYVYDFSDLYKLTWLDTLPLKSKEKIININAGFDETSSLLKSKHPDSELLVLDFYDPAKHTEVSIKRARNAYPPFPNTKLVKTTHLTLQDNSADTIFVILAAHEIRNSAERVLFFRELYRLLKPTGKIIFIEHLRDLPNLLAYNIGFLHFYSRSSWYKTVYLSGLKIEKEAKITPFITTFVLIK